MTILADVIRHDPDVAWQDEEQRVWAGCTILEDWGIVLLREVTVDDDEIFFQDPDGFTICPPVLRRHQYDWGCSCEECEFGRESEDEWAAADREYERMTR